MDCSFLLILWYVQLQQGVQHHHFLHQPQHHRHHFLVSQFLKRSLVCFFMCTECRPPLHLTLLQFSLHARGRLIHLWIWSHKKQPYTLSCGFRNCSPKRGKSLKCNVSSLVLTTHCEYRKVCTHKDNFNFSCACHYSDFHGSKIRPILRYITSGGLISEVWNLEERHKKWSCLFFEPALLVPQGLSIVF